MSEQSPFRQVVDDMTGGCGCACHTGLGYNAACSHCHPSEPTGPLPPEGGPMCCQEDTVAAHPADSAEALLREALERLVRASSTYVQSWVKGRDSEYAEAMKQARATLQASAPSPAATCPDCGKTQCQSVGHRAAAEGSEEME